MKTLCDISHHSFQPNRSHINQVSLPSPPLNTQNPNDTLNVASTLVNDQGSLNGTKGLLGLEKYVFKYIFYPIASLYINHSLRFSAGKTPNWLYHIGNRLFYFQTNPINKKHWQKKSEVK